ncbi:MucB/RseB C-terminal domain-containing protein [Colwellia sp. Bg11-28]|jgi:sigma-E factor negative regulatory protein RseB|uniref:MucB/RseB C-terminal domain-containing protein n=1 Tax=Colwellia sp. Bg11-28 TaxID=2058305 RepID=UPI000C335538|nr:MucB/RseB C-terminal domain-containing protein [Colwellia sp. Bg11-28]PKH85268.1 transcriptional regulator [Colwellia sp. Bg11-28]
MKLSAFLLLLLSFNVSAITADTESAKFSLERLSNSLRQLNFSTSFVVVKNNQAEPYHWLHGIGDNEQELEIFTRLNGPRRDVLRQGEIVSYIEPEQEPYSIISSDVRSPIPSIFRGNISELEESYRFISVGRSRILGRVAQLVRIVSKDKYRFSYWLWLDQKTGLLLKMAVLTRQGQLLEQIQFTHIEVNEQLTDNLEQFQLTELPKVVELTQQQNKALSWQVDWLPQGFSVVKSNQHRLNSHNQGNEKAVEFMLFSDGLVEVSVYVNPSQEKFRAPEYASDGATIVFNHILQGIEVGIVGNIPLATAKKIAESIAPAVIDNVNNNAQGSKGEQQDD